VSWHEQMTAMLAESDDEAQIIARVAALDIGKAELVCCVRVPAPTGGKRRLQDVSTHSTMTKALTELANRLAEMSVERVVMEATSSYWKSRCPAWPRKRPGIWCGPGRRSTEAAPRSDGYGPPLHPAPLTNRYPCQYCSRRSGSLVFASVVG
jgi:hypothetical protein